MTLGDRIKNLRQAHNISKKEFAEMFGAKPHTVTYWEKDTFAPRLDKLMKIAKHFDVSAEWMLYGSEQEENIRESAASEDDGTANPITYSDTEKQDRMTANVNKLSPSQQIRLLDYINSLIGEHSAEQVRDIR
ncbi:MAG: helix-turn-helix domain-containing protein [Oscillospiraceae bacterium]|jgi:transcriptional regulator with XRE-family HTH domain|nr:helix-turn-helix domain-containing protein [Oscillospiraceae bacterium]